MRIPDLFHLIIPVNPAIGPHIHFKLRELSLGLFVIDVMGCSKNQILGNEQSTARCGLLSPREEGDGNDRSVQKGSIEVLSLNPKQLFVIDLFVIDIR